MSRAWRSWALALLVAAVFFWGVVSLFNRQFASGELYPEFSTLRTDRLGTKLLFDSLGKLPGITVERNFLPMEFLPRDGATLVLLGVNPMRVNWDDAIFLRPVERIASRGNRVVVALYLDVDNPLPKQEAFDRPEEPKTKGLKKPETPQEPPIKSLWKVSLKIESDAKNPHPLYFGRAEGWRVRDKLDEKILSIERDFGKGSVVLMAESADFTNQSAVAMDRLQQVSATLGPYRRIVFDEEHLGLAESGSVVGMARQFRLMGLALGLALCAALFIWRNASGFPPPAVVPLRRALLGPHLAGRPVDALEAAHSTRGTGRGLLAGVAERQPARGNARAPRSRPKPSWLARPGGRWRPRAKSKPCCTRKENFELRTVSIRDGDRGCRYPQGHHRAGRGHPLFAGGGAVQSARAHRRGSRIGEDAAGAHPGRGAGFGIQAHPVHPRPDAGGYHRDQRVQPAAQRVLAGQGPAVHHVSAGRRDQPRARQDAVGAARSHAGAHRHHRPRKLPAVAELHRFRHPEPHRERGHVPAAGSAEGPLHAQDQHELAEQRRRALAGPPLAGRGGSGGRAAARRRDAVPGRSRPGRPAAKCWRPCR